MLKIGRRLLPEFGTAYGPAGDGPFPGIVILHGSEGGFSGWSHRLATLFGVEDATWSVAMTRRLSERLRGRAGHVETHLYAGEGHLLRSEAENLHHERLLGFFSRYLDQEGDA